MKNTFIPLVVLISLLPSVFYAEDSGESSGVAQEQAVAVSTPSVAAEPQPVSPAAVVPVQQSRVEPIQDVELADFDIYVARGGDSLQLISTRYYGDESGADLIWKYNRFIKNPKRLRPGLEIIVPLPKKSAPKVKLDVAGSLQDIVLQEQKKERAEQDKYMIVPGDFKFDGFIVGQKNDRTMISSSEIVYIDRGLKDGVAAGDRFNIYRPGREIEHPDSGEVMGTVVEKIGQLEVIGGVEQASAAAMVISAYEPISIGDVIRKLK